MSLTQLSGGRASPLLDGDSINTSAPTYTCYNIGDIF